MPGKASGKPPAPPGQVKKNPDLMADTTVTASAFGSAGAKGLQTPGIVWLSNQVGGIVFVDGSSDLVGSKTTDGGINWSAPVALAAGTVVAFNTFADQRIPGDNGTKIHTFSVDSGTTDGSYAAYDISTGTWSSPVVVDATASGSAGATVCFIAKTMANGFVVGWASGAASAAFRSDDGITWAAALNPYEANVADYTLGVHVNTGSPKDSGIIFGDTSAAEYSVKMYSDAGNTWTETAIATAGMGTTTCPHDVTTRLSDGQTIFAFWNLDDDPTADLEVWQLPLITLTPTPAALPKAVTDSAESGGCGIFVDNTNDDLYVAYLRGAAFLATVQVFKRKYTAGAWGVEQAYSEAAASNLRSCRAGSMGRATQGGMFQPVWFDDTLNDLYVNLVNDVEITPAAAGGTKGNPHGMPPGRAKSLNWSGAWRYPFD